MCAFHSSIARAKQQEFRSLQDCLDQQRTPPGSWTRRAAGRTSLSRGAAAQDHLERQRVPGGAGGGSRAAGRARRGAGRARARGGRAGGAAPALPRLDGGRGRQAAHAAGPRAQPGGAPLLEENCLRKGHRLLCARLAERRGGRPRLAPGRACVSEECGQASGGVCGMGRGAWAALLVGLFHGAKSGPALRPSGRPVCSTPGPRAE